MDLLYDKIFVRPFLSVSLALNKLDRKVIDGLVDSMGVLNVLFAHIMAWLDRVLVDGLVGALAISLKKTGNFFRHAHSSNIHAYILITSLSLMVFLAWMVFQ